MEDTDRKLVFIKLEGKVAAEFDAQRKELEDIAKQTEPDAVLPPEMFVSFMLDIRRQMLDQQKAKEDINEQ